MCCFSPLGPTFGAQCSPKPTVQDQCSPKPTVRDQGQSFVGKKWNSAYVHTVCGSDLVPEIAACLFHISVVRMKKGLNELEIVLGNLSLVGTTNQGKYVGSE